jgi:hypothetical protein
MQVAGFTIIRNAIRYDYPVQEAILSVLPLCDVFYVGVGNSDDATRDLIAGIPSSKIVIMDTVWDDGLRKGGELLAIETNKIFDAIPLNYDWCFYIQSDECVHEDELKKIKEQMLRYKDDPKVDGLLFDYKHFYGQYNYIGTGRRWYRQEVRIIRNNKNIRSYKDAQGFRTLDNRKLCVKRTGAYIYHYGWVKPPKTQQAKQGSFHKMWHDDNWMEKHIGRSEEFDYSNIDLLEPYYGPHPLVMAKRIKEAAWEFSYDRAKVKTGLKYRLLHWIEKRTGWRVGENRNFRII